MAEKKLRVVHYLNQFFGQIGGEEKATTGFMVKEGPVGPGLALQKELGDRAEIVATVICGDDYFASNSEQCAEEGWKLVKPYAPDLFFAGPAFAAGRYGVACGAMCKAGWPRGRHSGHHRDVQGGPWPGALPKVCFYLRDPKHCPGDERGPSQYGPVGL